MRTIKFDEYIESSVSRGVKESVERVGDFHSTQVHPSFIMPTVTESKGPSESVPSNFEKTCNSLEIYLELRQYTMAKCLACSKSRPCKT